LVDELFVAVSCGAQHQKEHWSEHKDLCKVVQKILKKEGKKSLFAGLDKQKIDSGQWKTIRYNYMVMVEGALQVGATCR
jgi:hypothetical protein